MPPARSAAAAAAGGLVGGSGGTIGNAYWDTGTSGQSSSGGGTAQTTATFQADSLSTLGFDSSVWGTGTGLYPYLKSFFPNGAQAVSGIAYGGDGTVLAFSTAGTNTVSVDAGGALVGQTNIDSANGYYYVLMPAGSIANGADLLISPATDGATGAVNAATLATSTYTSGTPGQGGINLYGGFLSRADRRHHIVCRAQPCQRPDRCQHRSRNGFNHQRHRQCHHRTGLSDHGRKLHRRSEL